MRMSFCGWAAACEGASTHPIAKSIINSYEERKTSAAKPAGDFSLVAVGATVENIREQAGEGVFAELEGKLYLRQRKADGAQ